MKKIGVFSILNVLLFSCVPTHHFKMVVSENEIFNDTIQKLGQDHLKQKNELDSLQEVKNYTDEFYITELERQELKLEANEELLAQREKTLLELKRIIGLQQKEVLELKNQVCEALKCYTVDELNIEVKDGKLYVSLSDKLLFPTGSDVVNRRGEEAISQLAMALNNSEMEIIIEGHTDTIPIHNNRNMDNWDLSVHRATSVARIFIDSGIHPDRIIAAGRSKFIPVSDNHTETGRQLNRRTEIVLAPNMDKLWELTRDDNISFLSENQHSFE